MSLARLGALIASLALSDCAARQTDLPKGIFILPGAQVEAMLRQCSRQVPAAGEASWQPRLADLLALEKALPATLAKARPERDWSAFPGGWVRQYVGIVRGDRQLVYGNYVPADVQDEVPPGSFAKPMIVCDGGAAIFGAEYDVAAKSITHLAFNGRP